MYSTITLLACCCEFLRNKGGIAESRPRRQSSCLSSDSFVLGVVRGVNRAEQHFDQPKRRIHRLTAHPEELGTFHLVVTRTVDERPDFRVRIEGSEELFGFAVISNLGELEGDRIWAILLGGGKINTPRNAGLRARLTRVRASSSCAREMTSKTRQQEGTR